MGWFITSIILTIIAVAGGFIYISYYNNDNSNEKGTKDYVTRKFSLFGLIFLLIIIPSFIGVVATGEVGIKTRWGKIVSSNLTEGLYFKFPYEKIVKMNIKVQKLELETSCASKDLQDVTMKLAVNYRVDYKKATSLYKNVGTKYEETILNPTIQESVKAITSKYTAEELITKRNEVSDGSEKELLSKVSKYGLSIDSLNITDFDFSAEFNKAIEEKQVAEQKVLTAKQELERERIEADKKIVKAEAEKKANEMKQQTLTDNIIKEKFIEKWDGKTPVVVGEGSILDVSSLIK